MKWRKRDSEQAQLPFLVDEITQARLGHQGLTEVAANLWPHECQTCTGSLVGARPVLRVTAVGEGQALADLHHLDCQQPRWLDSVPGDESGEPKPTTVNFVACPIVLPTVSTRTSAEVHRPFLLVNPGLEHVLLLCDGARWRVGTAAYYEGYGLQVGDAALRTNNALIPSAMAYLDRADRIIVRLGDLRADWVGDGDPEFTALVHDFGGVALAVSTAFHPALDNVLTQLADAIETGQVAGGWVPLTT